MLSVLLVGRLRRLDHVRALRLPEDETELPDLHFVSTFETLVVYPDPVDVRAIEAAHVANTPPLGPASKLGMTTADGHVVQEHFRLRRPPHADDVRISG